MVMWISHQTRMIWHRWMIFIKNKPQSVLELKSWNYLCNWLDRIYCIILYFLDKFILHFKWLSAINILLQLSYSPCMSHSTIPWSITYYMHIFCVACLHISFDWQAEQGRYDNLVSTWLVVLLSVRVNLLNVLVQWMVIIE